MYTRIVIFITCFTTISGFSNNVTTSVNDSKALLHSRRLLEIKKELMHKLGYQSKPENRSTSPLPQELLQKLSHIFNDDQQPVEQHGEMVIFREDEEDATKCERGDEGYCMTWKIPEAVDHPSSVRLWLYLNLHPDDQQYRQRIEIWWDDLLLFTYTTAYAPDDWLSVYIPMYENVNELNLWVNCTTCEYTSLPVDTTPLHQSYIVITTTNKSGRRKRSTPIMCREKPMECCVQEFYVTFEELEMDWIVFPEGFYPNYCMGSCTEDEDFSKIDYGAVNAYFLYKMGKKKRRQMETEGSSESDPASWRRESLRPCCSASASSALSIMESFNSGKLLRKRILNDAIVEECGCF